MRTWRVLCILLAVIMIHIIGAGQAVADDGYRLWPKYDRITDQRLVDLYRGAITGFTIGGESETAGFARTELAEGLTGLLGTTIPPVNTVNRDGILVAGTPQSSPLVRNAVSTADIEALGDEGYLIRDTTKTATGRLL